MALAQSPSQMDPNSQPSPGVPLRRELERVLPISPYISLYLPHQVRRFDVSSSVCFGISHPADMHLADAFSTADANPISTQAVHRLDGVQLLRLRVQCVPCEPAQPPVRPACPASGPPTTTRRTPRAGHVLGQSASCPDHFTVEVEQD